MEKTDALLLELPRPWENALQHGEESMQSECTLASLRGSRLLPQDALHPLTSATNGIREDTI